MQLKSGEKKKERKKEKENVVQYQYNHPFNYIDFHILLSNILSKLFLSKIMSKLFKTSCFYSIQEECHQGWFIQFPTF